MRDCARETRLSPERRREPSVWLHQTQLSRDANIKESRLFMYIDKTLVSDSGRFLCVNAYFGASIYILFYFLFKSRKTRNMENKTEKSVELQKAFKFFYSQLICLSV